MDFDFTEEEIWEMRASRAYDSLTMAHVSYLIDRFTWEKLLPVFLTNIISDKTTAIMGYEGVIFLAVYAISSYLVGLALGSIWLPLVYLLWSASIVHSFMGADVCAYAVFHMILLLREIIGGWKTKEGKVVSVYPTAHYQPVRREEGTGMRCGLIVLTIGSFAIVASMFVAESDRHVMASLGMVLFFVAFVVLMPNAGGNNIWANLPYLMYFLLIMLFLPAVKDFLDSPVIIAEPPERKIDVTRAVTLSAWDGAKAVLKRFDFSTIYVAVDGPCAVVRLFVAMTFIVIIFVDKLFGSGSFMDGAKPDNSDKKGTNATKTKHVSGSFNDRWILIVIVGFLLDCATGFWMRVYVMIVAIPTGFFIQKVWMAPIWETKGAQSTLKWLRLDTLYPTGEGVGGARLLLGKIAIILMNLAWMYEYGMNVIPFASIVSVFWSSTDTRVIVSMISHLSGIWWMLIFGVWYPESLLSDLQANAPGVRQAQDGQPEGAVGGNSGLAEVFTGVTYNPRKMKFLGKCRVVSEAVVEDMTLLRSWRDRTGGSYEIETDADADDGEVVYVTDSGRRYLRHVV